MSGFDALPVIDAMVSHALSLGVFDAVNGHEPIAPPTSGLTAAVWNQSIEPVRTSGLSTTSGLLVFNVRLYTSMQSDPADAIDPNMMAAESALIGAYSGDFTFGANVRNVDLLGQHSPRGLHSLAGYLNQGDGVYRVRTLFVPIIVDDLWEQAP